MSNESIFSRLDGFLAKLADKLGDDILKLGIAINTGQNEFMIISFYDTTSEIGPLRGLYFKISKEPMDEFLKGNSEIPFVTKPSERLSYRRWIYRNIMDIPEVFVFSIAIDTEVFEDFIFFVTKRDLSKELKEILKDEIPFLFKETVKLRLWISKILYLNSFLTNITKVTQAVNNYLYHHSLRVADLSALIAHAMELNPEEIQMIRHAGLIHDVGKLWVPREILDKPSKLTKEEFEQVKLHVYKLKDVFAGNKFMKEIVEIARLHHEKMDGSGYMGIRSENIPIESRILAVADIVDALLHDRPYRKALSIEETIMELISMAKNGKLDWKIVRTASKIIPSFYTGAYHISPLPFLNVGKEVTVQTLKVKGKMKVHKGAVIGISKDTIEVSFNEDADFSFGERVIIWYEFGDMLERLEATSLSESENVYTFRLDREKEKEKCVRVLWNLGFQVVKVEGLEIESKMDEGFFANLWQKLKGNATISRTDIIGGDRISFFTDGKVFEVGDLVLGKFVAYGEPVIVIGSIVKHEIMSSRYKYWMDYLDIPEEMLSRVFRSIFRRQIELKIGLKFWRVESNKVKSNY
ncbi:MAG: hypothetical protein DRP30_05720 [Thermotoga sp.]|nr:MAG: hypothetical protein DRP30_05720 [Thermotoga sp.]